MTPTTFGEKFQKFVNGDWDKHIDSNLPSSVGPIKGDVEVRICPDCHEPAEPQDVHYPWGEIEFAAYWVCVNKDCPYYDNEIPNGRFAN